VRGVSGVRRQELKGEGGGEDGVDLEVSIEDGVYRSISSGVLVSTVCRQRE
jgi:hypothetical protein